MREGLRRPAHFADASRYRAPTFGRTPAAWRPGVGSVGATDGAAAAPEFDFARVAVHERPTEVVVHGQVRSSGPPAADTMRLEAEADAFAARNAPAPPSANANAGASADAGTSLDFPTRRFFEQRLGRDLGAVRIHAGPTAARAAESAGAIAYTTGNHVVMGASARSGDPTLLGHELAHVVQQRGGAPRIGLSAASGIAVQRRTITRDYAAIAGERGPICDVRYRITGAPEGSTDDLATFEQMVESGILSACGTLRGRPRINITIRYRRGMVPGDVSNEAFLAARVAVLGPTAIPPVPDPAALARERRERDLDMAIARDDWQPAAEALDGFPAADQQARLRRLTLTQLGELRRGATSSPRLAGGARLAAAIDAINPDARRVATLIESYESALSAWDMVHAAEHLNGFNDDDLRARLRLLSVHQITALRRGAVASPLLAGAARLLGHIDAAGGRPPAQGVGVATFDGATFTVTKNGRTHSCAAFTGSVGAPTPSGRFCVRPQGAAQRDPAFGRSRATWFLLEPQFTTRRSRMQLHPGVMKPSGCITVRVFNCFDQLAAILNLPGTDFGTGYDGYPPGNEYNVTNPQTTVDCAAWLDVR